MGLRWLVGELKTGRITGSLPLIDSSWSIVMDGAGMISGSLTMADPHNAALNPRAAAEPGRSFLAAVWTGDDGEDVVLEAGPIWTWNYTGSDKRLKIGAAGVWSYYDHRKLLPVLSTVGGAPAVTYESGTATSLGTIAKRLIVLAHTHTNGALPIVLPDDVAGDETREYAGSELAWIGQKLRDLTQEDGGPEIAFVPRLKADDERYIEWVLRTGTPDEPLLVQAGDDWVWDASLPASNVADFSVDIDGTGLASRAWAAGASSGENRLIEYRDDTTLTDFGWPLLEVEVDGTDTTTSARVLASRARQAVTAARVPVEAWTLHVRAGSYPIPGMVRPGDWGRVAVGDAHPFLGGGEYRGRVTQVAGGDTDALTIQFQPSPGQAPQPVAVVVETPTVPEEPPDPDPEDPEPPVEEPDPPPDPEPPAEGDDITWLSGAFLLHDATKVTPFGAFRDRPVAVLAVFPAHNTQAAIANTWYLGSSYIPAGYSGSIAIAMPMCDDSHDVSQNITAEITSTANALNAYGDNLFYIRLGWEMNLPQWAWKVTDANLSTWRSRFSTYADIFTSILGSQARIVFNPNVGANQSGLTGSIEQAYVHGKVHVAGPDAYDCWPPFTSPENITEQMTTDQGLDWWADFCRDKDIALCYPEWGVSSGTQWAGHCGNDNPDYIDTMVDYFIDNADVMEFEAYFNEPAEYVKSDIWLPGGGSNNPLAQAAYVARYATP